MGSGAIDGRQQYHRWGRLGRASIGAKYRFDANGSGITFGAMTAPNMALQSQSAPSNREGPEKPNEVIDLVFHGGPTSPLGPLQHDLYNVVLAWAQIRLRTSPPDIATPDDAIENVFEFPLSTVAGLCGYGSQRTRGEGSKNMEFFLSALMGLRDRSVVFAGLERLAETGFIDGENEPRKRWRRREARADEQGGFTQLVSSLIYDIKDDTLRVELPKLLCRRLLQSEATTKLATLILPFSSRAACVLWELYQKHWKEGNLPRRSWQVWSRLLSADRSPHKTFREFNKLLRRALLQVNEHLTDHELIPCFAKKGRAVDAVWFEVSSKVQPHLQLGQVPNDESVGLLVRYGVRKDEALMLRGRFEPERIRRNVEYALKQHKSAPKRNLGGYMVRATFEDWGYRRPNSVDGLKSPAATPQGAVADRRAAEDAMGRLVQIAKVSQDGSTVFQAKEWLKAIDASHHKTVLEQFNAEASGSQVRFVASSGSDLSKAATFNVVARWLSDRIERGDEFPHLVEQVSSAS